MLSKFIYQISETQEIDELINLLFTSSERKDLENRLRIFEMLLQQTPQREIAATLGVGIATVTRGAQALKKDKKNLLKKYIHQSAL